RRRCTGGDGSTTWAGAWTGPATGWTTASTWRSGRGRCSVCGRCGGSGPLVRRDRSSQTRFRHDHRRHRGILWAADGVIRRPEPRVRYGTPSGTFSGLWTALYAAQNPGFGTARRRARSWTVDGPIRRREPRVRYGTPSGTFSGLQTALYAAG